MIGWGGKKVDVGMVLGSSRTERSWEDALDAVLVAVLLLAALDAVLVAVLLLAALDAVLPLAALDAVLLLAVLPLFSELLDPLLLPLAVLPVSLLLLL